MTGSGPDPRGEAPGGSVGEADLLLRVERGDVLGVGVDLLEQSEAVDLVLEGMRRRLPWRVSLLAVHGVMGGALHRERRRLLNRFELNLTCGQPVRWALDLLDDAELETRVYGPELTLRICEKAAGEGMSVFLYGSEEAVLERLERELVRRFPGLRVAGTMPSAFGPVDEAEQDRIAERIRGTGASVCLVGLGCPRQEPFIDAMAARTGMPMAGVGGSFEFIAGTKPSAPGWMKDRGLEWSFRLATEPRRLWRRFLFLNPLFLVMLSLQAVGLWRPSRVGSRGEPAPGGPVPG